MNWEPLRENLLRFIDSLQTRAADSISEKNINLAYLVSEIPAEREFALYETGNICEGVRRVLAGEDSPSNFVAFIQQDKNIEGDNRLKVPELAYEIQQKIFDPVLPILKQAGFPVKEGKVPQPIGNAVPITRGVESPPLRVGGMEGTPTGSGPAVSTSQNPALRQQGPFQTTTQPITPKTPQPTSEFGVLDERNLRALMRIAVGTSYTEEQMRQSFTSLPPGLQRAITSVDTGNAIQDIAKKFILHVDQMGALASETGLVLLGLTHPRDFVGNVAKRLRVSDARALEMAREVSEKILSKVREALRGLHESPRAGNTQPAPAPASVPAPKSQVSAKSTIPSPMPSPAAGQANASSREKFFVLSSQREKAAPAVTTPYSSETKWNLGEKAPDPKIQEQRTERMQKDTLSREVEKPRGISPQSQPKTDNADFVNKIEHPRFDKSNRDAQLETKVGPTGWRPGVSGTPPTEGAVPALRTYESDSAAARTTPVREPEKMRPQSEPKNPPPETRSASSPPGEGNSLISEKLSGMVSTSKEEKRYTLDPYREPLE